MNKIQYFDIETSINDKRNIKGIELENKIKLIFISDPNINYSSCSVGIGAGYLHDTYPGTAHFLEHLLFLGSEKYPEQNEYHSYIQINGGEDNAFTGDNITCYYLALETSFLKKGIEMLSWFFRAPLLNESHIDSEMEIIDSEHNKNILSDAWIMDDIFKNFIQDGSKYKKFGTGNLKSLNGIKKQDIYDFYNKYYTTDNMYVCVVDSKDLNSMISEYLHYFQAIPLKVFNSNNSNNSNRFKKDKIEFIENDLIFFNSSSDYLILNYYLIMDVDETNLDEYQLVHFISYLIGTEYYESMGYYLKENNIIKNINSGVEYFYDYSANINIQFIMINDKLTNIIQTYKMIKKIITLLIELKENEFIGLYENFRKIKTLQLLYNSTNDPVSISNEVVENMVKGSLRESIVRNNKVPEYNDNIFTKYKQILNSIKIKISTNINFNKINGDKFINSKWYSSSYFIDKIRFEQNNSIIDQTKIIEPNNFRIYFNNIVGIRNFIIKNNNSIQTLTHANDGIKEIKNTPELIYESDKLCRKIYLMEQNKYNKPIGSITVIRKNDLLLEKHNKVIVGIYEEIVNRTLNYFLEVMGGYKLNFNMSIYKEHLIYNFIGIEYELSFFISNIIKQTHPDVLLYNNKKSEKYFEEIIRDLKEYLENFKYNPPYNICSKYITYLLDNNLLPEEKLTFISNLNWNDFVKKIHECLKYSYEYYLMIGIKKYGYGINVLSNLKTIFNVDYDFKKDQYINNFIDLLELNHNNYLILKNNNYSSDELNINKQMEKKLFHNYTINSFDTNPNEVNNCLTRYWVCSDSINIIYETNEKNIIRFDITKKIIKTKLIMSFVANILNEPLFDKIRTIDKLGYIVKVNSKIIYPSKDLINFIIIFLVQSSYSTERINSSINNFSKFILKDMKNNRDEYIEKFKLLKKSKLIDLKKPFSDIVEELSSYVDSIVSKNFIFDINSLYEEICDQIDFSTDIEPIIYNIVNPKSKYYDIILNKKN